MKSMIRVSALALIAAGIVSVTTARTETSSATPRLAAMNSATPVPVCPPNDPTQCGLWQVGGFGVSGSW